VYLQQLLTKQLTTEILRRDFYWWLHVIFFTAMTGNSTYYADEQLDVTTGCIGISACPCPLMHLDQLLRCCYCCQISLKDGYKPTKKAGLAKMAAKPVGAVKKVRSVCV